MSWEIKRIGIHPDVSNPLIETHKPSKELGNLENSSNYSDSL